MVEFSFLGEKDLELDIFFDSSDIEMGIGSINRGWRPSCCVPSDPSLLY